MKRRTKGALFILILALTACQSTPSKKYISIPSLIQEQVTHVDSSLYAITQYVYQGTDSLPSDTIYIPREAFKKAATEFLSILDLSLPSNAKRFTEQNRYDPLLERVIITYTPIKPNEEDWQKQELMVKPDPATGDKVTTILASKVQNNRNGLLQVELLWLFDRSFQVTQTTQAPGKDPVIITYKVIWNDHSS
ncbi:MAG: hypothetical protein FJY19_06160 [Bacteroidetes bacterium]|nr:hypothetical protein [Bacteroidota bacterium]